MIVLLDRNFDNGELLNAVAATKAELLVRLKRNRKLPVRWLLAEWPAGKPVSCPELDPGQPHSRLVVTR